MIDRIVHKADEMPSKEPANASNIPPSNPCSPWKPIVRQGLKPVNLLVFQPEEPAQNSTGADTRRRSQIQLRHTTFRNPTLAQQLHHVLLPRLAEHQAIQRQRVFTSRGAV